MLKQENTRVRPSGLHSMFKQPALSRKILDNDQNETKTMSRPCLRSDLALENTFLYNLDYHLTRVS